MLFSLSLILLLGAIIRFVIKKLNQSLPYTVILLICGIVIGIFSKTFCKQLHQYTAIARVHPKVILFIFLPIIIFESAYAIPTHVFMKSIVQVICHDS